MVNSRAKGARGERLWRDRLRDNGFTARRGQQFSGGSDSPDVICEELKNLHMEVKFVENLSLKKAIEQAERDSGGKPWIIAHKRKNEPWMIYMKDGVLFMLMRDGVEAFMKKE